MNQLNQNSVTDRTTPPEMDPLTPMQLQIANLSASGYDSEEIKAIVGIADEVITNILDLPNVKRYRQITVDNIEMDVNIKRLSGGKKVLDKVIAGINKIVDTVEEKKWTMVHFKMFEWLTKEIPKLQKETKNIQATQINLTNKETKGSSEIDTLLNALPLNKKLEYFQESETILRAMVKEVHDSQVVEAETVQ